MCCEQTPARPCGGLRQRASARRNAAFLLASLLLGSLIGACGKKGDPMPPLRVVPQTTRDLKIRQQGATLLIELTFPSTTTAGLALGGIDAVELYELVKPALDDGRPPVVEARELEAAAQLLLTLRGTDLGATVTGDRIQIQLPLEQPLPSEPQALNYAVRTVKGEESSQLSNRVALVPITPPPPPEDLEAAAGPDGVTLTWVFTAEDPEAFDVFRREAANRGYGEPLQRVTGDNRRYLDTGAAYGRRYIYTVHTVASRTPLIMSAEAGEREVDYQDRFAPPLPERFVALGERGAMRLRWDASAARDVAGYILYRREPGRDFHRLLPDLVAGTEYLDTGLAAGLRYDYRIQVVDGVGNESAISEPVSATVR